jgi:predicted PhzF superfamily epimerase YddE/YHI9
MFDSRIHEIDSGCVPYYVVDAFSDGPFTGNPAGVCPLEEWPPDDILQKIAAENNLAETAFFKKEGDAFHLRWFAPMAEVDLCGHATLAAAHVLYDELGERQSPLRFFTRSGLLTVARQDNRLQLDLPTLPPVSHDPPLDLLEGLKARPLAVFRAMDWVCVFDTESTVKELRPDLEALRRLDLRGVLVTAPGREVDYVLRCFGPRVGIPEDPVTGSAQSMLVPYWAGRLKKSSMQVRQLSARGGTLFCELANDRVKVAGNARTYMRGAIFFGRAGA